MEEFACFWQFSLAEIAKGTHCSKKTVQRRLRSLEEKGWIARIPIPGKPTAYAIRWFDAAEDSGRVQ